MRFWKWWPRSNEAPFAEKTQTRKTARVEEFEGLKFNRKRKARPGLLDGPFCLNLDFEFLNSLNFPASFRSMD